MYTALEDDEIAVYRKDFDAKHPDIQLKVVRLSTGIVTARLLAEKDNPQADVVWGTAATSLLVCDQVGVLKGYNPKGIEKFKPGFYDMKNKEAHWVGIKAYMTGIVGNTIEMEANGHHHAPFLCRPDRTRCTRATSSCPTRPRPAPAF